MDPIRQLWLQGVFEATFKPPNILYAYNSTGEKFIVIDDNSTIYRVMNSRGQVFLVAHFRCVPDPTGKFYTCGDPMHIYSCTKNTEEIDHYAKTVILPKVSF